MSHNQIQKYKPCVINGVPCYWCNVLRAYIAMGGKKRTGNYAPLHPPIDNGRNRKQL